MKFKLDENFGVRTQSLFLEYGHDVHTAAQEGLSGAADHDIYAVSRAESRCLVTLDLDFADVVRFPPHLTGGIVVIRCPRNPSLTLLERLIRSFLMAVNTSDEITLPGRLWIVEIDRIRVHQRSDLWDDD